MDIKSSFSEGRKISPVMRIIDLPWVIMVDILSRLSIKPIFQCKTVCKFWYKHLTSYPLFIKMYQTRSLRSPCILLLDGMSNPSLLELKDEYDYYVRRYNRPIQLTPKFHYPPGRVFLIGSCNGFICLLSGLTHIEKHSVYISNPLLGEYFELKLPKWKISVCHVAYGFCFTKASGEYKVLRLVVRKLTEVSELEVCTLGIAEKWRNVGEIPCPVWYNFGEVNVNGALHWMTREENDKIYSFDIETEKIKSLPTPPGLKGVSSSLKLAALGNYLCLTDHIDRWSANINIWWMKEYGVAESWTKNSILVDSIPLGVVNNRFEPIFIWKDGEILIQSGTKLASYNPQMKTFRMVDVYGDVTVATRYIPTFYSLKTIIKDNFQVTNIYPKTKIV